MNPNFQTVIDFLDNSDYSPKVDLERNMAVISLRDGKRKLPVSMHTPADTDIFRLSVAMPSLITDKSHAHAITEIIARANFHIITGGFVYEVDKGLIAFRICHVITGDDFSQDLIRRFLSIAYQTINRYYPAFAHFTSGHTPGDSVFLAEIDDDLSRALPPGKGRRKQTPRG